MSGENTLLPIPRPLNGLNTVDPFIDFDSGYARELTNYMIVNGRLRVRPSTQTVISVPHSPTASPIIWFAQDGSANYWTITADGNIRRLSDGSGATDCGGAVNRRVTQAKHASLSLLFGARAPRISAYPFTAWTFTLYASTLISGGDTTIIDGVSHKGRLYVFDANGNFDFSDIGQITGAMFGTNTFADFLEGQTLVRVFSITAQTGNDTKSVMVVFGSDGLVLVFDGNNPDDSSWEMIGRYRMPPPISNLSFVEIDGDLFIGTNRYAYWFRDLFTVGAQAAYENSPTAQIENLWQGFDWGPRYDISARTSHFFYIKKTYDVELDAIICQAYSEGLSSEMQLIAHYGHFSFYLAYFRKYKAWAFWPMAEFLAPAMETTDAIFANAGVVAAGSNNEIKYLDPTYIFDSAEGGNTYIPIETSWKTPYFAPNKTSFRTPYFIPFNGTRQTIFSARLFHRNSISGYFEKVRAIFDFSDFNTPFSFYTQSTVTAVNPGSFTDSTHIDEAANAYGNYIPLAELSGTGFNVSLQFTQKPKSDSASGTRQIQELFGAVLSFNDGGSV